MSNIFVGNLSWATTAEELRPMFAAFGRVDRIDVVSGYALVQMPPREAGMAIAQLHGARLKGRSINVREALPEGSRAEKSPARPNAADL